MIEIMAEMSEIRAIRLDPIDDFQSFADIQMSGVGIVTQDAQYQNISALKQAVDFLLEFAAIRNVAQVSNAVTIDMQFPMQYRQKLNLDPMKLKGPLNDARLDSWNAATRLRIGKYITKH